MRILVTNDDGIHAEGLQTLERIARTLSQDVWIIAPEMDQSGVSHSLTLSDPLRLREISPQHFALKGTPTDCVIMGVKRLMENTPPDIVLSGVNRGQNLADDLTYSGTVAGAIEGTLLGIRSIALSQAYGFGARDACRYETAEELAPELISKLIKSSWPPQTLMNINFPDFAPGEVKGVLLTKQGKRLPDLLHIEKRNDGRGFPYYWIGFKPQKHELIEDTDLKAVTEGYISVTPLQLDLTDHTTLTKLRAELAHG
jgi:5'-nucleotidase